MSSSVSPEITRFETQPTIVIPVEASLQNWNLAIEKIPIIVGWLGQNGIEPAGPLFFRYIRIGDYERPYSLEIGFPLSSPAEGSGEALPSEIPGGSYLVHLHAGHPDELFEVDKALRVWATEHQIQLDTESVDGAEHWVGRFEFFLTNPDEQPDPNQWETRVAWKIRGED